MMRVLEPITIMSTPMLQRVYLSSTWTDLKKEYRPAAMRAIIRRNCLMDSQELYCGDHRPPLARCLEDVRNCDVYIGVLALRYGSIPEGHDVSYTELEYREAVQLGKKIFVFLFDETEADWPSRLTDKNRARIDALRDEWQKSHMAGMFTSPQHLDQLVGDALLAHLNSLGTVDLRAVREQDARERALAEYLRVLRKFCDIVNLSGLPEDDRHLAMQRFLLRQLYVPLRLHIEAPGESEPGEKALQEIEQRREARRRWEAGLVKEAAAAGRREPTSLGDLLARHPRVVVLGDPGAGKTTLLRWLATLCCCVRPRIRTMGGCPTCRPCPWRIGSPS